MPKKKELTEPAAVMKEYRCTQGHHWYHAGGNAANRLQLDFGMAGSIENLCPHCAYALVRRLLAQAGNVTEVTDGNNSYDGR